MKTLAQFSLEDAQKIAEESDYAFAASETDCNPINWGDAAAFVLEGYKACLAELTRWHDPKEELPEERRDVEVKTDKGKVSVCNMDLDELGHRFWNVSRTNYMIPDANIIGWREIHE